MLNIILKFLGLFGWTKKTESVPTPAVPELPKVVIDPIINHPSPEGNRKVKLGVIVGHTKKEPGASMAGGGNEYAYNTEIAKLMQKVNHPNVDVAIIYRDNIGIDGAYNQAFVLGCDCVVELHFNAFNRRVTGTLTYTSPASEDVAFAHIVHRAVLSVFGLHNRKDHGVVCLSRSERGGRNVHSFNGMPNCLVEPAFGDVESEAKLLKEKKEAYATALIAAVVLWAAKNDMI